MDAVTAVGLAVDVVFVGVDETDGEDDDDKLVTAAEGKPVVLIVLEIGMSRTALPLGV